MDAKILDFGRNHLPGFWELLMIAQDGHNLALMVPTISPLAKAELASPGKKCY